MTPGEGTSEAHQGTTRSIIRTQDVVAARWKNGAGLTREIATLGNPGAGDDFTWRVSVADLMGDASFSTFPGLDRTFLVASGSGVVLHIEESVTLVDEGRWASFRGEDDVRVTLLQGPATAVNLMTTRSHEATMQVLPVEGAWVVPPDTVAVLVLRGSADTSRGEVLRPMDFLVCGPDVEMLDFTRGIAVFMEVRTRE